MDRDLVLAVQRAVGVDADGDFGNVTLAAVAAKLGIVPKKSDGGNKLISIAETQLGILESSKNHGEGIAKFWTATNYPEGYNDRAPYCAAALCWMIREAGIFSEEKRPKTAAAFGLETWGEDNGLKVVKHPSSVKAGDVVVFAFSHVAIATSDSDSDGRFSTIEANTSPGTAGSQRDGGGVYRRMRNLSAVRSSIALPK